MNQSQQMVERFHEAFGHPIGAEPNPLTPERIETRLKWMREELDEFELWASRVGDPDWDQELVLAEMYDAMIDANYFIYGTLVEMGLDGEPGFRTVHVANMEKLGSDGRPILDEDGKIQKPEGWAAPSHIEEIRKQTADSKIMGLARQLAALPEGQPFTMTDPVTLEFFQTAVGLSERIKRDDAKKAGGQR